MNCALFNFETEAIAPGVAAVKITAIKEGRVTDSQGNPVHRPFDMPLIQSITRISQDRRGLIHLAEKVVDAFPERLGTPTMISLGNTPWTLENKLQILAEIPRHWQPSRVSDGGYWLAATFLERFHVRHHNPFGGAFIEREMGGYIEEQEQSGKPNLDALIAADDRPRLEEILRDFTPETLRKLCREVALKEIPSRIVRWIFEAESGFGCPWYFDRLISNLWELFERESIEAASAAPATTIGKTIAQAFDFARASRGVTVLELSGKLGESISIDAYVAANRGRCLAVEVPPSTADGDLLRSIASALNYQLRGASPTSAERAEIWSILQRAGLLIIFLRAHFLIPARHTRDTPPLRLALIAANLIEKRVPVAFVASKAEFQFYSVKFKRATAFPLDVWLGERVFRPSMPESISTDDLLALARHLAPDFSEAMLEVICLRSTKTQLFYPDIERIVALTRFHAESAGRVAPAVADLKAALAQVLPGTPKPSHPESFAPTADRNPVTAPRLPSSGARSAAALPAPPPREVRPLEVEL